jgi:hypothetical protein
MRFCRKFNPQTPNGQEKAMAIKLSKTNFFCKFMNDFSDTKRSLKIQLTNELTQTQNDQNVLVDVFSELTFFWLVQRVWVNQRNCFPPNVFIFPLPPRASRQGPGGGRKSGVERKSAYVRRKTVTMIYPYPLTFWKLTILSGNLFGSWRSG